MKNTRMRFLVDDLLRRALVHMRMTLELKEQIQDVNQEQHNAGTTTDFEDLLVGVVGILIVEGCVKCSLDRCQ
jgi:hypothetical protein